MVDVMLGRFVHLEEFFGFMYTALAELEVLDFKFLSSLSSLPVYLL
jgi:hypothetical protein